MTAERRKLIKRGIPLLMVGFLIFFFYLYFFGGIGGLADIVAELQTANPFYYSFTFISVFLSMLFYSLAWHRLMNLLSIEATFRKAFLYVWVGALVDILVPVEAVSGEVSKAYLMSKNSNVNSGKVVASIVSHRILSMTITLGGLIISSVFFALKYKPPELILDFIIAIASCTAVSIIILGYLSVREQTTSKIVNWVINLAVRISKGRWELTGLRSKAEKMLKAFHQGIDILTRNPRALAGPVVFSIVAWFFDLLIAFLVFTSIGFEISLSAIIMVYSVSVALQTIPIGIPGEVGFMEIVMTSLYTLLGVPIVVSAAVTVLTRVVTLWFRLIVGYAAVQWIGIKVLMGGAQ
ncbi:flippase-like domain-containing protein [Candidatus Bathyarchaeota archaeon]|nr:flippase-like domain-containing protein [Candidatus Bathyarchaeota archaeon]